VHVLQDQRNAIVIPCPWDEARSFMPWHIAAYLLENGIPADQQVEVWENLTRGEAEWHGTLAECAEHRCSDMSIMLIRTKRRWPARSSPATCPRRSRRNEHAGLQHRAGRAWQPRPGRHRRIHGAG
jgi:hypothetical protein